MVDLSRAVWRKSSRSSAQGQCVEIAFVGEHAAARDSKSPGPVLVFGAAAFRALVQKIGG
jgi:hypothetical protein